MRAEMRGFYPTYKYDADITVGVPANVRCWFSAQFMSHPFPGQGGRLSTVSVTGWESMFKSGHWGSLVASGSERS